jgi:ABC-2 type transport system permease protein
MLAPASRLKLVGAPESNPMNMTKMKFSDRLRIIGTIALKDILDAIRNRTTLSIILGVALIALTAQALPLLLKLSDTQRLAIYDEGDSEVVERLRRHEAIRSYSLPSPAEVQKTIGESSDDMVGIILPADFDERLESGAAVELEGYVPHWLGAADAYAAETAVTDLLTELTGQPIRLSTRDVYPAPDADGRPFMMAMSLVTVAVVVCAILVPLLLIEEKETHTLDALLVSPASAGQVVIGKALAGMVYGVLAAAAIYAFNLPIVVHWEWAVLAVVSGSLFAVGIGLLMGSIFDNQTNLNLWLGITIFALIIPVIFGTVLSAGLSEFWQGIMPWIPTVALADLFRVSFAGQVPLNQTLLNLGIVFAMTAVLYMLVIWHVRQTNR